MTLPLEDIKILDLSRMLPGPYCSMILSDLGADVIHINDPMYFYGDPPPYFEKGRYRESAFSSILMRNKRSITLNLKKEEGKTIFYRLVKQSDVILETFRPKVTTKLRIDYETVSKINPSIIYCSITGYGQEGPYEQIAGHDNNYVGICGIIDLNKPSALNGNNRKPILTGVQSADIGGALTAVIGILGAIRERDLNPEKKGQYIDISMLDSVFSFMPLAAAIHFSEIQSGVKNENILHGDFPFYSIYETKDNKYLSLGAIEVKFWHAFCDGLGRDDLKSKQTAQGEERIYVFQEVRKELLKKTQKEWMNIFITLDSCVMPVKSFAEACKDPQILARNMITELEHPRLGKIQNVSSPIKYSRTPLSIRRLAPKIGDHSKEIFKELNYSDDEIKSLKKNGVF